MQNILIDGSRGEGGGQVVRTSLAIALLTGRTVTVDNVRAGRKKPGLLRQHLTAARAAAEVSGGELEGAEMRSGRLSLRPGRVRAGSYRFAVGTAGSANLVLQTILPPLLTADGPSRLVLEGGTHNTAAPSFDYLQRVFAPLVGRMGPTVSLRLERHGFYPAGGGHMVVEIEPAAALAPFELHERGPERGRSLRVLSSKLPDHVAERQLREVGSLTGWPDHELSAETVSSPGPGNVVLLELEYEHVTEQFTAFGRPGLRAEKVAASAVDAMRRYLRSAAPVGEHLADQLVLPLAMAGGGGFTTRGLTLHARTQVDLVRELLGVPVREEDVEDGVRVTLG